jgi:hypothetical protein
MLDDVATALTIGTCIFVCAWLAVQTFGGRSSAAPPGIAVGSAMKPIADVQYDTSELTVLVGLSSTCRYCTESMPAFQRLNDFAIARGDRAVHVVAVGLEPLEVLSGYLSANGLTRFQPVSVSRESDAARVASRTPTVILVDSAGQVLVSWSGRMTTEEMDAALQRNVAPIPAR